MTEKRFIVIDDYTLVDIEEERLISTDEIVDKMNELYEENIMLKNIKKDKIIKRDYTSMGLYDNKTEKENEQLKKENKELKIKNDLLSDELEQCKAVINKKWSEYLKKKELS